MSFSEICIYQVKPDKVEEFEALMQEVVPFMERMDGVLFLRLARRTHTIKEMSSIKKGLPPDRLTRVVKSVRYMLYWEFESMEKYGLAQKLLYETHWKALDKCLVMPHNKYFGESPF